MLAYVSTTLGLHQWSGSLLPLQFDCICAVFAHAGKLFGLHSGDGHVMWSQSHGHKSAPQQIFFWRSQHDVQHAPELLALQSSQDQASFSIINAHTGAELSSGLLQHPVSQVTSSHLKPAVQPELQKRHEHLGLRSFQDRGVSSCDCHLVQSMIAESLSVPLLLA